jgi:DNA-binding NtrC family response regulator
VAAAARALLVPRQTLYDKLRRLKMTAEHFRSDD